ncbi:FAD/NAD(P)-binding protein [Streptomyces sp. NPDC048650]|uniref:FAD/NAD(P)-binding protein n=1 Tax=unclassified Streptomyces TaxID=2593676 RepID=UPI0037229BA7
MSSRRLRIGIVGAGPRGLSVLERLCANARAASSYPAVDVHVVDPFRPGAGQVWRSGQSRHLLMNTVASQITVYTDAGVSMEGPVEPGPSLYEWARSLSLRGPREEPCTGCDDETLAEARDLGPDAYPTRAFYGCYLEAAYRRIVAGAPAHVTVHGHRVRAVALEDGSGLPAGPQTLTLEDGGRLAGLDAVVLAQGHVPSHPTRQEAACAAFAAEFGLRYVPPANPAEVDVAAVGPGEAVLLRGLGLSFFDYTALFTVGRGGSFERTGRGLVYHPSGREPRLYAGSRRGVPYQARGDNEKGAHGRHHPRLLTTDVIELLRKHTEQGDRVGFGTDLWPLIATEVESVYYGTWLAARGRGAERADFVERYLAAEGAADRRRLLDSCAVPVAERWDWERIATPYGGRAFAGREEFRGWLLEYLRRDAEEARAGNVGGPRKAALDVLRDLRNEIRLVVDHGGLDGASYRDELQGWYTPLNAFLSIGPPTSRIEEMAALVEAGVLDVLGPGIEVRPDAARGVFTARSSVPGAEAHARVLIEARLTEPDLRRTADPLLRGLLASGQCTPYRIASATGPDHETGGLAVTARPYRLVDAAGRAHPRRFAYGVPTEGVHWVTAAGIRPGVDSVTLGDSDAIARTVLAAPPATPAVPGPDRPGNHVDEAVA